VRRLLENTSNESFLRASFKEHKSEDDLLMNPILHGSGTNGRWTSRERPGHGPNPFRNEPLTDFSREDSREAMQNALTQVAAQFSSEYPLIIGGKEVVTGKWMESHDPSNAKQSVGKFALARTSDAEAAVAAAAKAFPAWRDTPVEDRAAYLFQTAAVMR